MSPAIVKMIDTPIGRICFHVSTGERSQPTALLWPSLFTNGHLSWELQLDTLHALGFRTIVIDPPGHGGSGPPPGTFTMRQCSDAVLQILDNEGVERATMLGVSWGGFVTMKTAIVAPDRVAALVLSNTSAQGGFAMERFRDSLICGLIRVGAPGGPGRFVVPTLLGARFRREDPAFAARLEAAVNSLDKVALARAAKSVLVDHEDLAADVHRIRAPTLVVSGVSDTVYPPKHGERIAAAIAGARFEVIPGVAHLAPREDGSAFAALLRAFLAPLHTAASTSNREPA
jgi:3-oxoadipate enol-lactonase